MFSTYVKDLRISQRVTLREFCSKLGLDPSNWSKVERGINPPPGDLNILERLAAFFSLEGTTRQEFLDKALLARNELPPDLAGNSKFLRVAPAFFRNARGDNLSPEELTEFIEELKKLHTPDVEPVPAK
ncbi:helix-turn-helix domain-containing protein [Brevifollis gellanilyticus]|uniref:HTH cro/C1-type domain-containing protein n=1 Tax=Brevifollis gellanilyticus TaxID=748831 RepID=A0A512MI19_9BACT|nr:hypothetical protein BGE01nite_56770 [Brevifollis gellanilyticus]